MRAIEMVERAGDCDQCSIDWPEVGDAFPRRRVDPHALELAAYPLLFPLPPDAAQSIAQIASLESEVVHDGEVGNEREVLVDKT